METESSRYISPPSALNTLVDIALRMESTRIKKNDHSYSLYQKWAIQDSNYGFDSDNIDYENPNNLSVNETIDSESIADQEPVENETIADSNNDQVQNEEQLMDHIYICPDEDFENCAMETTTIDDCAGSPNTEIDDYNAVLLNLHDIKMPDKPDHSYATGNKKFPSLEVSSNIAKPVKSASSENLVTSKSFDSSPRCSNLLSTFSRHSDENINSSSSESPIEHSNTSPRIANKRRHHPETSAPTDIFLSIKSVDGEKKKFAKEHAYSRHKPSKQSLPSIHDIGFITNIAGSITTMINDNVSDSSSFSVILGKTDHNYGRNTIQPITICERLNDSQ